MGIGFLKSSVRRGVVPTMLDEIIKTRLMVKKAMKLYAKLAASGEDSKAAKMAALVNTSLQKVLHARQLGLKVNKMQHELHRAYFFHQYLSDHVIMLKKMLYHCCS